MTVMRKALAMLVLSALAAVAGPTPARADTYYRFQSPSENIDCGMGSLGNKAFASCEVADHTWVAPPRPERCEQEWGDRIELQQGTPPVFICASDTLRANNLPILPYGNAWSMNPLTCASAPAGMTCTDASTGHFFRISRDSYELH